MDSHSSPIVRTNAATADSADGWPAFWIETAASWQMTGPVRGSAPARHRSELQS